MDSTNPLVALAYVAGVVIGLPVLNLVVKGTVFITRATGKLDTVAEKQGEMAADQRSLSEEFKEFRHEKRNEAQGVELSLAILENDVNALQEKVGIPPRRFPDRRVSDRRPA